MTDQDLDSRTIRSIAAYLFRTSFRYYVLIAVALTALLAGGEYLFARAALEQDMRTYENAFGGALATALWGMDSAKVDAIVTGMVEIPDVAAVRVSDPATGRVFAIAVTRRTGVRLGHGDQLDAAWRQFADEAVVSHSFDVVYAHATGATRLGRVEMVSGRPQLFDRIQGQTGLIVAVSLFKEAVLWAIFLLVGRRLLVQPLRTLIARLNDIRPDDPHPIALPAQTEQVVAGTELAVVRDAVNRLIGRIRDQQGQLLAANSRLEDQVSQRTHALEDANQALRDQAQKLAASNTELEQFAYVASHDLRQPLRMVSSYMTLLERQYGDALDDDARTFIGFARDGAARMDRLILDLLALSRIGRTSRPFQAVAFAEVVATALASLYDDVEAAQAVVTVPDGLPVVLGDADELARLVTNLVGNAIKYRAADRAPRINLGWRPEGDMLRFWVEDNGQGIEAEHFDRVFQIFQRLHNDAACEGTGIGLAICRKIVDHHGGRIWVESQPGRGSSFLFTLPADLSQPQPQQQADHADAGHSGRP